MDENIENEKNKKDRLYHKIWGIVSVLAIVVLICCFNETKENNNYLKAVDYASKLDLNGLRSCSTYTNKNHEYGEDVKNVQMTLEAIEKGEDASEFINAVSDKFIENNEQVKLLKEDILIFNEIENEYNKGGNLFPDFIAKLHEIISAKDDYSEIFKKNADLIKLYCDLRIKIDNSNVIYYGKYKGSWESSEKRRLCLDVVDILKDYDRQSLFDYSNGKFVFNSKQKTPVELCNRIIDWFNSNLDKYYIDVYVWDAANNGEDVSSYNYYSIKVGMSCNQLYLSGCGFPDKVNTTETSYATTKQLVYSFGYVYLRNDIITSISYSS